MTWDETPGDAKAWPVACSSGRAAFSTNPETAALRTLLMAAPFQHHNNQGITSVCFISYMDFRLYEKTLCPQTHVQTA
jgi:hypothetical protein